MLTETMSFALERALVERNHRGMASLSAQLQPGYLARAAVGIARSEGPVLIGTGFPVLNTFETDGPAGAIALYGALEQAGRAVMIVCGGTLAAALRSDYEVLELKDFALSEATQSARSALAGLAPGAVIALERPGMAADQRYYNMRGEDISARCERFDPFISEASCLTIGIGDGGNEVGMGKVAGAVQALRVTPSATSCDELIVADVSNWGAYALALAIGRVHDFEALCEFSLKQTLEYLAKRGAIDGVTREATLTEDGLPVQAGEQMIKTLRQLAGF
jgi:hypothetical protein